MAALGRVLFDDPLLSADGTVSCADCHNLAEGGDDGQVRSTGILGRIGGINSPTVYNVGLSIAQFWDGRADDLHAQIDFPIQNKVEMGSVWADIVQKLYRNARYVSRFDAVFGAEAGITRDTVKRALVQFMTALATAGGRFDRWLQGDDGAITALERTGYEKFKLYGCVSCHQGQAVGGNMFQVFGVINEYFKKRGNITRADHGRFAVTGNPRDMHAFKVPSLRMVAHTAPYLHDGNAATLRDAVDAMFTFQLGRSAPDEDKDAIVAFLMTLAGPIPAIAAGPSTVHSAPAPAPDTTPAMRDTKP